MELRPRKGRSAQPSSTPSAAKSSARQPSQSVSRRKPASVPSSPILVPSDDEATHPKQSHDDVVDSSPNHERILSAETPLKDFVKSRRKDLSSTIKQKKKTALNANTKLTEVRPIVQQDTIAMEYVNAAETITENVYKDSIELGREKLVRKSKNMQSATKKSAAKSGRSRRRIVEGIENGEVVHEVGDIKVERVDDQEPSLVADALVTTVSDGCHHTLSLILSDDENAQVSGDMQVDVVERKDLASSLKEDVQAEAPKPSSKKKSRFNKDNFSEESLSRKLFEETTTVTLSSADIEPDEIVKRETCKEANPRKVEQTRIRRSVEIVSSTCEAQCSIPSSESLKETDQSNIESLKNNEKNFEKPDAIVAEEDVGNECTQTSASQELSCRHPFSGNERDEETGRGLDDALEVKLNKKKGVAMHIEDHNNTDDDNDSSSSDEDEGDLASIFANSMKAHLHISEPSVFGKSTAMQSEQDVQKEEESLFIKDAIEGSHFNGNISRLAGYGLSWSPPQVALSASKHCRLKQVGCLEARPTKIWEKDRCLQDGLCVPPLDPGKLNKLSRKQKKDTTGDKWYNLSAATITPDLKKELQLVKLRGVLDPKRHYKAEDSKGLPKYFQVGTVIGGPADFYSGRLTKKEQKNSLANELLSDSSLSAYRKRKYLEIQDLKQAGGKGFMKKKKSKRTPAWAKI